VFQRLFDASSDSDIPKNVPFTLVLIEPRNSRESSIAEKLFFDQKHNFSAIDAVVWRSKNKIFGNPKSIVATEKLREQFVPFHF